MSDRFGPDQIERDYAESLRSLLQARCGPAQVREAWELPGGVSRELWRDLGESGLFGIAVAPEWGGAGLGLDSLVVALEEVGVAAAPGPIVEAAAVVAPLLSESEGGDESLARLLAGDLVVTTGLGPDPYVPCLEAADTVLVRDPAGRVRSADPTELDATALAGVDGSRPIHRLEPAAVGAVLGGADLEGAVDRGAIATAAVLVGLGRATVDRAVEYCGGRRQFGRPIGSFQAVQHALAEAHAEIELARGLVRHAAAAHAGNAVGTVDEMSRPVLASMAKVSATRAATFAAERSLQAHGAMGYSFEYDLQLWLKRIWALAAAWGDLSWHQTRIGARLEL
ncbi:MAG TPA: acyl-CoA dehydrogenase family protein [Solirubrobacterales bacterium]|nr:acyl-CoA dehydrogenase family protein [Solirubrobacterales bacterium]